MKTKIILTTLGLTLSLAFTTRGADVTPGYNQKIPEKIMTPDCTWGEITGQA